MRVRIAIVAFGTCFVAIVAGFLLYAGAVQADACTGVVFDTALCEGARLRQSLFAAILVGSALIAGSIVVSALIISSSGAVLGRPVPSETQTTE